MLWCIVPGIPGGTVFHVDIDENQTVDDLKDKIKEAETPVLDALVATTLTLYKINIDCSVDNNYRRIKDEIFRGVYKFIHPKQELFPSGVISEYFKESDISQKGIHILVEFPTGESINSESGDH